MIKNVIFDFGGVLVDWNPRHLYNKYFADKQEMEWFLANVCTTAWNVEHDHGRSFLESIPKLQKDFPDYAELIAKFYDEWEAMIPNEIPGTFAVVRALKAMAGIRVLGLSNISVETYPRMVKIYPNFNLIEEYVLSGDVKLLKPELAIYKCLCDKYNLNPAESVFIDDVEKNVEGARRAGLHAIHFTNAENLVDELNKLGVQVSKECLKA